MKKETFAPNLSDIGLAPFSDNTRNKVVVDTKIDAENVYATAICNLIVLGAYVPLDLVSHYNQESGSRRCKTEDNAE